MMMMLLHALLVLILVRHVQGSHYPPQCGPLILIVYAAFRLVSAVTECPPAVGGYTQPWKQYAGYCYTDVYIGTQGQYDAGVDFCGQYSNSTTNVVGNLFSIHSQAENDFIVNNVLIVGYLMGLRVSCTTSKDSSCLSWADWSPVDYENFAVGEPQGSLGCAELQVNYSNNPGKWKSASCTADSVYYLCKVGPPSNASTTPSPSSSARAGSTTTNLLLLLHLLPAFAGLLYWITA